MRSPEEAVPEPGAAARPVRFLVAAIVVLASGLYLWLGKRKSPRVATHAAERPAVAVASRVGS